jgi:hypothetical protein
MLDLPEQIEFWHWWVLGVLLIGFEVFAPSTVFLWPGIAAGVVGLILLAQSDMSWQIQCLIFAVLSFGSLLAWRAYYKSKPPPERAPGLNTRGEQYINREFTLEQPIVNGQGTLNIDDTSWRIEGVDLPAGARVRVTGAAGVALTVEEA